MSFTDVSILQLILIATYLLVAALRSRIGISGRTHTLCLGILAAIGLFSYTDFVRIHPSSNRMHIHYWDVYHYYVGAKYFRELGYHGLYEATVVADREDDPDGFRPAAPIRDLRTNLHGKTRRAVLKERKRIKAPFSRERWREFKGDVGFFRTAERKIWRSGEIQLDHGYNGTPLTTAVLGLLANQPFLDTETFLEAVIWADLCLILLLTLAIARLSDPSTAFTFLFFWSLNPFNDYVYVGGSFLRYNYFLTLTLAIVLFFRKKLVASGICFSLSVLFRIFPVFFVLALFAHHLVKDHRARALRENRRLYLSFALSTIAVVFATSAIRTPDARNGWAAFYERITVHGSAHGPNRMGLKYPFLYSGAHNLEKIGEAWKSGDKREWLSEVRGTFEERRWLYYGTLVLLLVPAAFALKRRGEQEALFLGIFGLSLLLFLTHYYYCILALIPLIFRSDQTIATVLSLFMAVCVITGSVTHLNEILDLQYLVYSIETLVLLLIVLALRMISAPRFG